MDKKQYAIISVLHSDVLHFLEEINIVMVFATAG